MKTKKYYINKSRWHFRIGKLLFEISVIKSETNNVKKFIKLIEKETSL